MTTKGKLFLASEAKHPESLEKLEKFTGGLNGKSIVYCPTAANGECGPGSWRNSETLGIVRKLAINLTVVELENYYNEDVVSKFNNQDIIWIAGGMPGYLLYWLRRLNLDKIIPTLISKGSIYVGSSAGSMICAPTNYIAELFPGDEERGASIIPGLGLIDFEILPHYEDQYLQLVKKYWRHGKLYLLKNGEAITVVDGKVRVLGQERIIENR